MKLAAITNPLVAESQQANLPTRTTANKSEMMTTHEKDSVKKTTLTKRKRRLHLELLDGTVPSLFREPRTQWGMVAAQAWRVHDMKEEKQVQ